MPLPTAPASLTRRLIIRQAMALAAIGGARIAAAHPVAAPAPRHTPDTPAGAPDPAPHFVLSF